MSDKTYYVSLTLDELTLLDGRCSPDVQKKVDLAKNEAAVGFDLPVMNAIIVSSLARGVFEFQYKRINRCPLCDKKGGYHKYPRSSKHHQKGDSNYDSPLTYPGVKFNQGFISVTGDGDMCVDCMKAHDVYNRLVNHILENDLPIEIRRCDAQTRWVKDPIRICFSCKKEMQESTMIPGTALYGGSYPSGCPHCGAKSLAFGPSHDFAGRHVMIRCEGPKAQK